MLLVKMFKAPSFSKKERALLDFLWESYLNYNPRYASFLYMLMSKKPEETDYKLDLSNLKAKWVNTIDKGTMGAFNPLFPSSIFICCSSKRAIELNLIKNEEWAQPTDSYTTTDAIPLPPERPIEEQRLNSLYADFGWLLQVFPIVMHELYHMAQFKATKVGYVAMRLVSVFTCIPYYLFQHASWMPKFRKWFEWDIEGQAEKYGDKAPGIDAFCEKIELATHLLFWHDIQTASLNRTLASGDFSQAEYEEALGWMKEDENRQKAEYGAAMMHYATKLYNLIHELSKEED